MFSGGVETLTYFSKEMAKEFEKKGYAVFFYDLKSEKTDAKRLRKFIKVGETVMITFNFQGLEKEPGVYREREGYVWDEYRIPCYNIAADHPYYYHDRLRDLPKRYYHISIDRLQEAYFKAYYPEYQSLGFLPLAGTKYTGETACADKTKCTMEMEGADGTRDTGETAYSENAEGERTTQMLLTGNYTPPSFCEPYINGINEEYAEFYRGIIRELIEKPGQTVEAVAKRHCERELGKVAYDDLRLVFHRMIFIDLYVRNYFRGEVVKTLVEAGISVDVIGKGWEELECGGKENLHIHPQTDSETCLKELRKAKLSINVMPWFKDGAHDRVFNSILNGAFCLSDTSKYLCRELEEGEGVSYYDLQHLEELPKKVTELLQKNEQLQEFVAKGEKKVLEKHTWKQRAETLERWILQTEA